MAKRKPNLRKKSKGKGRGRRVGGTPKLDTSVDIKPKLDTSLDISSASVPTTSASVPTTSASAPSPPWGVSGAKFLKIIIAVAIVAALLIIVVKLVPMKDFMELSMVLDAF